MANPLVRESIISRGANATAAGQTDIDGAVIAADNFNNFLFVAAFGTVTDGSVLGLEVYGATTVGFGSPVLLAATPTVTASGASNKLMAIDIKYPPYPFLRCRVKRGTANAALDSLVAVRYGQQGSPFPLTDSTNLGVSAYTGPAGDPANSNKLPPI